MAIRHHSPADYVLYNYLSRIYDPDEFTVGLIYNDGTGKAKYRELSLNKARKELKEIIAVDEEFKEEYIIEFISLHGYNPK